MGIGDQQDIYEILNFLTPDSSPVYFTDLCDARLSRTCEWSINHPTISAWLNSVTHDTSHLWLHGIPGTGKSVLAAYLVEEAKRRATEDEVVLSFFCKDQGNVGQAASLILAGFIKQCLLDYPYDKKAAATLQHKIKYEGKDFRLTVKHMMPHLKLFVKRFKNCGKLMWHYHTLIPP